MSQHRESASSAHSSLHIDGRAPPPQNRKIKMQNKKPLQIAILLYPGVTALDAVGPWEILSRMPDTEVRFVGKEAGPVVTEGGTLFLGITHTLADTPSPEI